MSLVDHSLVSQAQRALDDLVPEGVRVEVLHGAIVMNPPPALPHSLLQERLRAALATQAPADSAVLSTVGVYESDDADAEWQEPDVTVARIVDSARPRLTGRDVELVVEVVSPSNRQQPDYESGVVDRAARYGIDWVLIVDPETVGLEQRSVRWWFEGTERASGPEWCSDIDFAGLL